MKDNQIIDKIIEYFNQRYNKNSTGLIYGIHVEINYAPYPYIETSIFPIDNEENLSRHKIGLMPFCITSECQKHIMLDDIFDESINEIKECRRKYKMSVDYSGMTQSVFNEITEKFTTVVKRIEYGANDEISLDKITVLKDLWKEILGGIELNNQQVRTMIAQYELVKRLENAITNGG